LKIQAPLLVDLRGAATAAEGGPRLVDSTVLRIREEARAAETRAMGPAIPAAPGDLK